MYITLSSLLCATLDNWHERWAFQSVAIQEVDWHDDNGLLLPRSAQAQAQLGAEIALFSQLWGTYTNTNTIHQHPTPGIVVFACP